MTDTKKNKPRRIEGVNPLPKKGKKEPVIKGYNPPPKDRQRPEKPTPPPPPPSK